MTAPRELWSSFAPAIAGRPTMRVGRSGGANGYSGRRRLSKELPAQPAAVMLYDERGYTRCIAADFDAKRPDLATLAAAESNLFSRIVTRAGGRVIVDASPGGGRHVYVLLTTPRHVNIVRALMQGMRRSFRTLDIAPMTNAATGCIRPPGSVHRRGGTQRLVTPYAEALQAVAHRNGDDVWRALVSHVGPLDTRRASAAITASQLQPRWRGRQRPLEETYARIARTGRWDRGEHPRWTRSEARLAVLRAAVHSGWLLHEVREQLVAGGAWQGLRQLYGHRWKGSKLEAQLAYEWSVADAYVRGGGDRHRIDTREHQQAPQGEAPHSEYAWLREWWAAMRLAERDRYASRGGHSLRLVLRALAAFAQRRGSRYVGVGVRSLALACNLDHSTVAKALRELRDEADPLVDAVDLQRGLDRPDIYALRIPEEYRRRAVAAPWRPGRLEAIHPAFAELGVPAAFVYEVLGEHGEPVRTVDVADVALLSERAARDALRTLAELGLAERDRQGWRRGPAELAHVADSSGAQEAHQERVEHYRAERRSFRVWIREHIVSAAAERVPTEPPVDLWATQLSEPAEPEPPLHVPEIDDEDRVIDLLARKLGARPVPT